MNKYQNMDDLERFSAEDLFNEAIRRGIITPDEAQIALMTKTLPERFDDLDIEGEDWKNNL